MAIKIYAWVIQLLFNEGLRCPLPTTEAHAQFVRSIPANGRFWELSQYFVKPLAIANIFIAYAIYIIETILVVNLINKHIYRTYTYVKLLMKVKLKSNTKSNKTSQKCPF